MDAGKILRDSDCEKGSECDPEKYFVFPHDIVFGILLSLSEDGIQTVFYSNRYDMGNFKNNGSEKSLASKLPLKENNKWLDLFFEYNNPKEAYYNFKKNGITEEGRNEVNQMLKEFEDGFNFGLEKDFIDLISGNVAWVSFFKSGESPDGALVLEISDSSKMLSSMEKLVEIFKEIQMVTILTNYEYMGVESDPELQMEMKKTFEKIEETYIEKEIVPEEGTLYKFKPYWGEDLGMKFSNLSLNFSLENNQLILGSSAESVAAILKGMQEKDDQVLAKAEIFKEASEKFYPERYGVFYMNTKGVWNGIQYYYDKFNEAMAFQMEKQCEEKEECFNGTGLMEMEKNKNDGIFASGALFRTIQFISSSSFLGENFTKNSLFFSIKKNCLKKKKKERKRL